MIQSPVVIFYFGMFLILYVSPHQRPCDRPFFNGAVTWSVLQRCAGHLHHPRRGRSSSCTKVIVTSLWQCWIQRVSVVHYPIYDFNSALHVNFMKTLEPHTDVHQIYFFFIFFSNMDTGCLQIIFKLFSKYLQNIYKIFTEHLDNIYNILAHTFTKF